MLRFLAITFLAIASAEVIVDGPCPEVKTMENFNFSEFAGVWYEIAKFPNIGERGGKGKCTTAEYEVEGDKGKVKNSHVIDGVKSIIEGEIFLESPGNIKITYKFGDRVKNSVLMIMDSDYKNYAVGYSCKYMEKENKHQVFSWILSRSKTLGEFQSKVDGFLNSFKAIDTSNFVYNEFTEETCKFTETKTLAEFSRK
ncbi:insecticyanin-B-like [Battus philenor]|uniref:insecticyanin-B-like n=1 Tax=Battus philenor TaxID=42288 RepID=UPI0035D0F1B9